MRGRPPKLSVVSTGKIGKEAKLQKEIKESKIKVNSNLKPPTYLSAIAKKEFKRVVKESNSLDLLDNLDLAFLVIYAQAYSEYIEITDKIKEEDLYSKDRARLYRLQKMQIETIMQCSGKLGLAISDRLRLVIPDSTEKKEENPFLKYL